MHKERIKSIILTLLIINCLHLTGQIWFNKKLWPTGYNFFNSVANNSFVANVMKKLPFARNTFLTGSDYSNVIRPQKIVISSGNSREVFQYGQKQYDSVYSIAGNVIASLMKTPAPRSTVITKDDWHSFLKGKSIYISFGFNMEVSSLSSIFGLDSSSLPEGLCVSDIVITGDSVTKEGIVCMLDKTTNVITKYWVDYQGDELLKYISSTTFGKNQNKAFAFELNLDSSPEDAAIRRKILLGSLVLLPMDSENANKIAVSNPIEADNLIYDRIVTALGYTPSSLRKSVSSEGVASYVENSATINISPNGLIVYKAIEADKGIHLQNSELFPYKAVTDVTRIVHEIWHAAGEEIPPELYLVSDLVRSQSGEFIIKMNYSFEGIPVITQSNDGEPFSHAVYATVKNGYLTSFKMLLRKFEGTDEVTATTPVIAAMDMLAERFASSGYSLKIEDIFKCYSFEVGISEALWGVKISDENDVVIISSR